MKNIYIIGVPRTGKSTLAKLIKQKHPNYNQISFEALRNGFIKAIPQLNMENRNSEARKNILPNFIFEFIKWNNILTNNPCIIEGDFISLDYLTKDLINDNIIICLGHGLKQLDEIVDNIKKYDVKKDYTYNWNMEKLKQHFYDVEIKDKINYNYAIKNNIKYFDTFSNREDIFNNILEYIQNEQ